MIKQAEKVMKNLQAVRGMNDVLPEKIVYWQHVEQELKQMAESCGYQEIRFPIVESTNLFKRSIGEVTDIVEKEMYTFDDRNGDSLTLRPEGTAPCVRAGIEHGLLYNQIQRLWYLGPMFRHERPQKGRYRQFYQFSVEAFGMNGPEIDAEIILMSARLWQNLGLAKHVKLLINSLGTSAERKNYREKLVEYFQGYYEQLDADSQRRLTTNPLRILDSKVESMQPLIKAAPVLMDHLGDESRAQYDNLCDILSSAGIEYEYDPRLVRGLDYYGGPVFEWVTHELGAKGTICAGGRYDLLVEQLGGKATPAVGFSVGIERVVELLEQFQTFVPELDAYILGVGEHAAKAAILIAENLRREIPGFKCQANCGGGSFKSQFKRADKSGAKFALILGDDELENQQIGIKYLREEKEQEQLPLTDLVDKLTTLL